MNFRYTDDDEYVLYCIYVQRWTEDAWNAYNKEYRHRSVTDDYIHGVYFTLEEAERALDEFEPRKDRHTVAQICESDWVTDEEIAVYMVNEGYDLVDELTVKDFAEICGGAKYLAYHPIGEDRYWECEGHKEPMREDWSDNEDDED